MITNYNKFIVEHKFRTTVWLNKIFRELCITEANEPNWRNISNIILYKITEKYKIILEKLFIGKVVEFTVKPLYIGDPKGGIKLQGRVDDVSCSFETKGKKVETDFDVVFKQFLGKGKNEPLSEDNEVVGYTSFDGVFYDKSGKKYEFFGGNTYFIDWKYSINILKVNTNASRFNL